jgi:hypothetical protein
MASGRYVDMEKAARQKKAAELDSISKVAKDRIAKASAKNDSTAKVVAPAPTGKKDAPAPAPKSKNGPAPAPKQPTSKNGATPAPAPKKQPASTEGKS